MAELGSKYTKNGLGGGKGAFQVKLRFEKKLGERCGRFELGVLNGGQFQEMKEVLGWLLLIVGLGDVGNRYKEGGG